MKRSRELRSQSSSAPAGAGVNYRLIQPAPLKAAGSGQSGSSASSRSPPNWFGRTGLPKRLKPVAQACHTCRKNKAKCDGVRPRCGGCTTRGTSCGYAGQAGQSRQAAIKSRFEALEKLLNELQSKPEDEAERLLQRIRSTNDVASLVGSDSESQSTPPSSLANSSSSPSSESSGSVIALSPKAAPEPGEVRLTVDLGASSGPSVAVPPQMPHWPLADASSYFFRLVLPSADTTSAGVQSFFSSCGRLFHVFSTDQVQAFYKVVFGLDGRPDFSQKVAICCLCAVAAVGIQYNPTDFEKGSEEVFYHISRHFLTDVIEERPLEAIKVCTLFALYNMMNKTTAALAYVEMGFAMSMRQSQNTGACHPSLLFSDDWVDFRGTWRALLFFSSWLSSTLGYISGTDDSAFTKLLPVAEQDVDSYNAEIGELVQAEMTKISLLEAGILRNQLVLEELTSSGMDGIVKELQQWHVQLPPQLRLQALHRDDLPLMVRWSLYHLHILYHGAFMLVYRRIAAECVRLQRAGEDMTWASRESSLLSLLKQGISSALDTARILSLLLGEQGVFKRCWIVICQAHTACVVIMHSIAQKQLHRLPPSSWQTDMQRAQQCLDVLEFCGAVDSVALRFRVRLSGIYSALANFSPTTPPPTTMQRVEDWVWTPPLSPENNARFEPEPLSMSYLFTIPPSPNPQLLKLSFSLLLALCRPWSDPESLAPSISTDGDSQLSTSVEQTQFLERLAWDFGKVTPFRWDTDGMGVLREGEVVAPSCFLDSEAPNGWVGPEDLEVDGEGEEEG